MSNIVPISALFMFSSLIVSFIGSHSAISPLPPALNGSASAQMFVDSRRLPPHKNHDSSPWSYSAATKTTVGSFVVLCGVSSIITYRYVRHRRAKLAAAYIFAVCVAYSFASLVTDKIVLTLVTVVVVATLSAMSLAKSGLKRTMRVRPARFIDEAVRADGNSGTGQTDTDVQASQSSLHQVRFVTFKTFQLEDQGRDSDVRRAPKERPRRSVSLPIMVNSSDA